MNFKNDTKANAYKLPLCVSKFGSCLCLVCVTSTLIKPICSKGVGKLGHTKLSSVPE